MGQDLTNQTRFCQIPQGSRKGLTEHLKSRRIFIAVGLSFILTTSLMYYLMLPSPSPPIIPKPPPPIQLTPHGAIEIDGDADFSATALLERWPGDGSPGNPFIINGLEIDLGGEGDHCIMISNTRVSFIISNCNLTRAYPRSFGNVEAGILLDNVTNGAFVENIVDGNYNGIILHMSDYNTVANNTCSTNTNYGICVVGSDSNIVANNTCSSNGEYGISLYESEFNTVVNNTCNNNTATPGAHKGISLYESHSNNVVNNTCNNNDQGIVLANSDSNTLANNTCNNNTIHGIVLEDESYHNTIANNTCNNNRIGICLSYKCGDSNFVVDNTCLGNTKNDVVGEFGTEDDSEIPEVLWLIGSVGYIGFMVIMLLGVLIVGNRVSKEEQVS